jgi:hypothetical protein
MWFLNLLFLVVLTISGLISLCWQYYEGLGLYNDMKSLCWQYYEGLGLSEEDIVKRMQTCSRHRAKHVAPGTPKHFWDIGMEDTMEEQGKQMTTSGEMVWGKKSVFTVMCWEKMWSLVLNFFFHFFFFFILQFSEFVFVYYYLCHFCIYWQFWTLCQVQLLLMTLSHTLIVTELQLVHW